MTITTTAMTEIIRCLHRNVPDSATRRPIYGLLIYEATTKHGWDGQKACEGIDHAFDEAVVELPEYIAAMGMPPMPGDEPQGTDPNVDKGTYTAPPAEEIVQAPEFEPPTFNPSEFTLNKEPQATDGSTSTYTAGSTSTYTAPENDQA